MQHAHEHNGHVVAAQAAHGAVCGQAAHHQGLAHVLRLKTLANAAAHKVADLQKKIRGS